LTNALDRELGARNVIGTDDSKHEGNADWITSEMVMRLPIDIATHMLVKHWDQLRESLYFIQAALYLATPQMSALVEKRMAECHNPAEQLKFLGAHYGIRFSGRAGITRKAQVEALIPYLEFLDDFTIFELWQVCNDNGWHELRKTYFDTRQTRYRGAEYLDEMRSMESLDRMAESPQDYRIAYWIDDFVKTGATTGDIIALFIKWFKERKTVSALRVLALALIQVGKRSHLANLTIDVGISKETSEDLITDTIYAVKRRTLL
jgi:hypothetical protein